MRKPVYSKVYAKCDDCAERAEMAGREFDEIREDLKLRGALTSQRLKAADRLARLRVEYEVSYPEVIAAGAVSISEQTGGQYFSYAWSALNKTADQILKLEEFLKIGVGTEVGQVVKEKLKTKASRYKDRLGGVARSN